MVDGLSVLTTKIKKHPKLLILFVESRFELDSFAVSIHSLFAQIQAVIDSSNPQEYVNVARFQFLDSSVILQRSLIMALSRFQASPGQQNRNRIRIEGLSFAY